MEAIDAALAAAPDVRIYVVDAAWRRRKNASLGELEIRASRAAAGRAAARRGRRGEQSRAARSRWSSCRCKRRRASWRSAASRSPSSTTRARRASAFDVRRPAAGNAPGFGATRRAADPLAVDNTRYFTVEVRPPARVLLLADAAGDAVFVREALEPVAGRAAEPVRVRGADVRRGGRGDARRFSGRAAARPGAAARGAVEPAAASSPPAAAAWAFSSGTTRGRIASVQRRGAQTTAARASSSGSRATKPTCGRGGSITRRSPACGTTRRFPGRCARCSASGSSTSRPATRTSWPAFANDEPAIFERSAGRGRC